MKKNLKFEKLNISELSKITGGTSRFTDGSAQGDDWSYGGSDSCWTATLKGDTRDKHDPQYCF